MGTTSSSAGASEKLPTWTDTWEPTEENLQALFSETKVQNVISLRSPEVQNRFDAMNVALKMKLLGDVSPDHFLKIVHDSRYIEKMRTTMSERVRAEGEEVKKQFTELIKLKPGLLSKLNGLEGFTDKDRKSLEDIIEHFALPDEADDRKSYLGKWVNRDAINGRLVLSDYKILSNIGTTENSPERAFLGEMKGAMKRLQDMDPNNLTFINTESTLRPGARFGWSVLFALGAALYARVAVKTGRMQPMGLVAAGLLLYLNRNRSSPLVFLEDTRYPALTKSLKGVNGGAEVFQALGNREKKADLKKFSKGQLSKAALVEALDLHPEKEGKLLLKMPDADIIALSNGLQRFSEEDMQIAVRFLRAKEDIPAAIAGIPVRGASAAAGGTLLPPKGT